MASHCSPSPPAVRPGSTRAAVVTPAPELHPSGASTQLLQVRDQVLQVWAAFGFGHESDTVKLALLSETLFGLEEAVVLSGSGQPTAVDVLSISSRCALDARTPQDVLHHGLFLQNSAESARVPALGLPSRVLLRPSVPRHRPIPARARAGTSGCRSIAPETPTPPAEFTLYCTRYPFLHTHFASHSPSGQGKL